MTEKSPWIIESSTETFENDVVKRSMDVPVVVDFWATWCEPCRQLAPMLEKVAEEYAGKFVLAKVNVDEAQEIAAAFGVQSIPVVVAIHEGQPAGQFMGLISEEEFREWLKTFLPSPVEELLKKGDTLEADDPAGAEACFREAAELAPGDDAIKIHLARVLLAQDRDGEARRYIDDLQQRGYLEPQAETIKSQLDLRAGAEESGGVEEARKAVEAAPDNLSLQIKLADALAVTRKHEEALQICLVLVQRDKSGIGDEAKETMLKIFDLLGPSSDLVSEYRRKLATALY